MMAKYDPNAEAEVRQWIAEVTGDQVGEGPEAVYRELRSGVILCKYVLFLFTLFNPYMPQL